MEGWKKLGKPGAYIICIYYIYIYIYIERSSKLPVLRSHKLFRAAQLEVCLQLENFQKVPEQMSPWWALSSLDRIEPSLGKPTGVLAQSHWYWAVRYLCLHEPLIPQHARWGRGVNRKSDLDIQDVWKREGLVQVTKENDGRNPEQHLHDMFFTRIWLKTCQCW